MKIDGVRRAPSTTAEVRSLIHDQGTRRLRCCLVAEPAQCSIRLVAIRIADQQIGIESRAEIGARIIPVGDVGAFDQDDLDTGSLELRQHCAKLRLSNDVSDGVRPSFFDKD
jgi:hypothetical protein